MIFRFLAVCISLLGTAVGTHRPAARHSPDQSVLGRASVALATQRTGHVLEWLRDQPDVRSAQLGQDGRTVDVTFVDGTQGAILPSIPHAVALPATRPLVPHDSSTGGAAGGRALVLQPFASELYLGPLAGYPEARPLRAAGFFVDQAYDEDVTVSIMAHLSDYNVVYMLTHSGVNSAGEGVIATGQLASGDPAVQPYLDDHTVMIVQVTGSPLSYYGVLSGFFVKHEDNFPPNAFMFVNGCSILKAKLVWQALASKGVGTMVSWDDDAMQNEDSATASVFFDSFGVGKSVAASVKDVLASGHGRSLVHGAVAQLGYLGDPNTTLQTVLHPPTPTPIPTETPLPTATAIPTATATPRPTATPVKMGLPSWPRPVALRTSLAVGAGPRPGHP